MAASFPRELDPEWTLMQAFRRDKPSKACSCFGPGRLPGRPAVTRHDLHYDDLVHIDITVSRTQDGSNTEPERGGGAAVTSQSHFDVVVVGLGPVGAAVANLLGAQGIRTLVIEKDI